MDFFDQRILASLKDGKPKHFNLLLAQVGFSHNTLQQHLRCLVDKGLIVKQKQALRATGRPKFIYHLILHDSEASRFLKTTPMLSG